MLQQDKVPVALHALHQILYTARHLTLSGAADSQRLYRILDWAEVLPTLITCREEDTTEEFRSILAGLGEEIPEFSGLLANFDANVSWPAASELEQMWAACPPPRES
jgi:hypothetical protein